MLETMKNLMLAGLGAAVLTKEKAMHLMQQAVEKGELSAAEAEKMADEVVAESKRQAQAMGDKLTEAAREAAMNLNLASKEELDALSKRVAALEKELAELKAASPPEKS
ncbi:MAG: hypothetical protein K9K65_00345 [Desulfarculaceae bacterium]|nr:hypothetical protein [Desulfarculaceae bacterium]MCF8048740.1 hypothetical protein [Desulfarculaceae bacterium]MCF8064019.1 hypothetical protein [Desulfarculaceae bacterium]MCF8096262.1 hypothetical protein [Desulfarculaceae bacterium]MCF8123470.1 hypothetical protein [Desulfarculaceae bacterium]